MELTNPVSEELAELAQSRDAVQSTEEALRTSSQEADKARQELAERQARLRVAIIEHPELTNIERAAWLFAVRGLEVDGVSVESIAEEILGKLSKLETAFNTPGTPILQIENTVHFYSHFLSYQSLGQGLNGTDYYRQVQASTNLADSKPFTFNVEVKNIDEVVDAADEIGMEALKRIFADNENQAKSRYSFVIGEDAIIAFAMALRDSDMVDKVDHLDMIQSLVSPFGLRLEGVAEMVQQRKEELLRESARMTVVHIMQNIVRGHARYALDTAKNASRVDDIPQELIIQELKLATEKIQLDSQWLIDELQNPSTQKPTEPAPGAV